MDKESVDFKILDEMQQGSMITVVFGDDTKVTGQVSEKILVNNAYDDEDEYYFFKIKFGGDCTLSVDSREIKGIERCTTRDAGLITGRVVIEKYGISCNRYMGNVITEVANEWDELNNTAKEEISKVFESSMNWIILRDMLGTMNISKKCNKENHEKIMELLDKEKKQVCSINEFLNKYKEIKNCMTAEASKMLDAIIFDYCGFSKILNR